MEIGLFFGSFNPIHIGHLIISNRILDIRPFNEIWFIVSPLNPFKENKDLADEYARLKMVELALKNNSKLIVSDIEFHLNQPSYTIKTLEKLNETFSHNFHLIIGSDNIISFHKWKEYERILEIVKSLVVYNRPSYQLNLETLDSSIKERLDPLEDTINLDISATQIRKYCFKKQSISYLTPEAVCEYIEKNYLYK